MGVHVQTTMKIKAIAAVRDESTPGGWAVSSVVAASYFVEATPRPPTPCGAVWSWGCGEWGRLGLNKEFSQWVPSLIRAEHLGGLKIKRIGAGAFHSAAVTSDGGRSSMRRAACVLNS
jgi:hypothetical protein